MSRFLGGFYHHHRLGSFLFGHESGHSIARPTAYGSRVPPQRTVLRETPRAPGIIHLSIEQAIRWYVCRTPRTAME